MIFLKKEFPVADKAPYKNIRNPILVLIQNNYPDFNVNKSLAISELNRYREKYISNYLLIEVGELSNLEAKVIGSLKEEKLIGSTVEVEARVYSIGRKVADKKASFGESLKCIIFLDEFILLRILAKIYIPINKGFDKYPFVFVEFIFFVFCVTLNSVNNANSKLSGKKRPI